MRVGGDIGSICRKCGDTWHVVVAVVAGDIVKVECKQCGGRHRYKSPEAASRAAARRVRPVARKARASSPAVEAEPSQPARPYHTGDRYAVGEAIMHQRFGRGVVQALSGPNKVQVWFPDGEKVLVHARGA